MENRAAATVTPVTFILIVSVCCSLQENSWKQAANIVRSRFKFCEPVLLVPQWSAQFAEPFLGLPVFATDNIEQNSLKSACGLWIVTPTGNYWNKVKPALKLFNKMDKQIFGTVILYHFYQGADAASQEYQRDCNNSNP